MFLTNLCGRYILFATLVSMRVCYEWAVDHDWKMLAFDKAFLPTSSRLTQELKVRTVIGILSCDKAGTEFALQWPARSLQEKIIQYRIFSAQTTNDTKRTQRASLWRRFKNAFFNQRGGHQSRYPSLCERFRWRNLVSVWKNYYAKEGIKTSPAPYPWPHENLVYFWRKRKDFL